MYFVGDNERTYSLWISANTPGATGRYTFEFFRSSLVETLVFEAPENTFLDEKIDLFEAINFDNERRSLTYKL